MMPLQNKVNKKYRKDLKNFYYFRILLTEYLSLFFCVCPLLSVSLLFRLSSPFCMLFGERQLQLPLLG
jgi:hypothetical protein